MTASTLVDSVKVPIIYFSVKWWSTPHRGLTVSVTAVPKMASTMLTAALLMTLWWRALPLSPWALADAASLGQRAAT
jgi:hypothetical protein